MLSDSRSTVIRVRVYARRSLHGTNFAAFNSSPGSPVQRLSAWRSLRSRKGQQRRLSAIVLTPLVEVHLSRARQVAESCAPSAPLWDRLSECCFEYLLGDDRFFLHLGSLSLGVPEFAADALAGDGSSVWSPSSSSSGTADFVCFARESSTAPSGSSGTRGP